MADEATIQEVELDQPPSTRSELLKLLKGDPFNYTGSETLADIKSFLTDNQIDLGEGFDVEACYKRVLNVAVKVAKPQRTDDEIAERIGNGSAVQKGINRATAGSVKGNGVPLTPEQHTRMALRKRYDRKAQRGETVFPDADTAESWGAMLRICATGGKENGGVYSHKGNDIEILKKTAVTYNDITGGAFVPPPELSLSLIELREKYGVFEANAKFEEMANDRKMLARNNYDQQMYWTGEATAGTESDPNLSNPALNANKLLGLSLNSSEVLSDNAISIADMTARSFARQSALKIDTAAFLGTGTAAFGGFIGLDAAFLNITATRANIAGAYVATGDLWSEVVLNDLIFTQALLPAYAQPTAKWYMHSAAYFAMAKRLQLAQGGVTYAETREGGMQPMLLGYPVVFVQALSPVGLTGTVYRDHFMAYYGDLSLASSFGRVRNSLAFETSKEYAFNTDRIALRYRERVAILNHDVGGDTSLSAPLNNTAGPIVGLLGKAS